ncbi:MAG TPA: hydroxyisourate hydrolase [Terracidiphilus sp.]|nr:hydroxyisourate hydrolase [Terracidiphilus sp.]
MSRITTHLLDAVMGKPASGVAVRLERHAIDRRKAGAWVHVADSQTDADGRCRDLTENALPGTYRLTFETGSYLARHGRKSIYPEIQITFTCSGDEHYHLPLLLSDNSYTTYRGS